MSEWWECLGRSALRPLGVTPEKGHGAETRALLAAWFWMGCAIGLAVWAGLVGVGLVGPPSERFVAFAALMSLSYVTHCWGREADDKAERAERIGRR